MPTTHEPEPSSGPTRAFAGRRLRRAVVGALAVVLLGAAAGPAAAATRTSTTDAGRSAASTLDISSRASSLAFWRSDYTPSPDAGWTGSIAGCDAGTTSAAFKASVGKRIDYFRAMAGIPGSVTIDPTTSAKAQQAALMMAANGMLSHSPPTTWACYTPTGAEAAGSSNLNMGSTGADSISSYINDAGAGNTATGHRRWVLFPPRTAFGTGDVPAASNTNALWAFGATGPRPTTRTEFVAWPPAGYVPIGVIFRRWSMSLPGADFSGANVTMTRNGVAYPVTKEPLTNGYGDNTLAWTVPDIGDGATMAPPSADTSLTVTVTGAVVGGVTRSFGYTVTAFDPDPKPDLVVTSVSSSPASPRAGDAVTFSATVKNVGNAPTPAGVSHRTMFTVDNSLTASADSSAPLAPGASTTVSASSTWRAEEGTKSVRAYADWNSAIDEYDEWNNTTTVSLSVAPGPQGPDLVVVSVNAPATAAAGDQIVFSAQVGNLGNMVANGPWRVSFLVDGVEVQTGDRTGALSAGYTTSVTASGPAPWRATAGSHTVTAVVDSLGAVAETDEGNNTDSKSLSVTGPAAQPDLVVDSVTATPGSPVAGDPVQLTATIRNAGTAATTAGTTDVVRFSVDGSQVSTGSTSAALAVGATTTVTAAGTWSAVQGGHTIAASADANQVIAESDEGNNARSDSLTVSARPDLRPDLAVTAFGTTPASPAAGDAVTFRATVRNNGSSAVPAGTSVRVAFASGSTLLSWADTSAGLAPGASVTLSANGGPGGSGTWTATGGPRNVTVTADSLGVVDESAEWNNTWTSALRVSTATVVQDSKLGYGGWLPASVGGATVRLSSTAGDTAELAFTGKSVSWLTRGGPDQGRASVMLDGVNRGTVDLYRAGAGAVSVPFTGLSAAPHRLQIRVLGTANPASTGTAVAVDGLKIGTSPALQETSDRIAFGGWSGAANTSASGGHLRSAATAGATSSWTFTGTGVDWVSATGPSYGEARVLIDGVDRGVVDLYAATASWQRLQSFRGLGSGTHTVVIQVLGSRNAASTGNAVVVDGLRILS